MLAPPPKGTGKHSKTGKYTRRASMRPWFWCLFALILVGVAIRIAIIFNGNETVEPKKKQPSSNLIKEHAPSLGNAVDETKISGGEVKPVVNAPRIPVGNVMTARTAKTGRVMTLMDGTVITNRVERPFKRDLEHALWVALRPGNMGAGLITTLQNRHSDYEIIQMLKEMTVPEPGDSEGMVRIKAEVQELKENILLELDSGRSLSDIFDEIRNQGIMESKIKADTMRLRAEAIRSGDPQQVRETVQRVNEIRVRHGLEPLTTPEEFQEQEYDQPYTETFE